MVIILRITATITTFGNLPAAVRRSWNAAASFLTRQKESSRR
jgi:hypothetical protein